MIRIITTVMLTNNSIALTTYIYIYIYIEREIYRERDVCVYIYIVYIYTHLDTNRITCLQIVCAIFGLELKHETGTAMFDHAFLEMQP